MLASDPEANRLLMTSRLVAGDFCEGWAGPDVTVRPLRRAGASTTLRLCGLGRLCRSRMTEVSGNHHRAGSTEQLLTRTASDLGCSRKRFRYRAGGTYR